MTEWGHLANGTEASDSCLSCGGSGRTSEAAVDEVQVVSEAVGVTIARRIREVRKARAWSQDDLAARIREIGGRISRPVLYRIEEGGTRARRLSVEEFLVIAAALGVAPLYLMTDTSDAPGRQTVLTTKIAMEPRSARAWMAGTGNPPGEESMRVYISQRPESELVEMHKDWAA